MKISTIPIRIFLLLFFFLLPGARSLPAEEIVVIVNNTNPGTLLTSREVSDIFLGRRRTFPSGEPVLVLEQERDSFLRREFFKRLNGMTLKRLNAYWARLQFSGQVQPPPVMPDSKRVIEAVGDNADAIGYVNSSSVDDSVRIVLRLKDG